MYVFGNEESDSHKQIIGSFLSAALKDRTNNRIYWTVVYFMKAGLVESIQAIASDKVVKIY